MTKIEEIQALSATNSKLRKEWREWPRTGPCSGHPRDLCQKLSANEAALRKAYDELLGIRPS